VGFRNSRTPAIGVAATELDARAATESALGVTTVTQRRGHLPDEVNGVRRAPFASHSLERAAAVAGTLALMLPALAFR
jgi:hypothetical protein